MVGVSYGLHGTGVWGKAKSTAQSGTTYGVYGHTASRNSYGVYGIANSTDSSGFSYGVYGESDSPLGVGGLFENTASGLILLGRVNPSTNLFTIDGNGDGCFAGTFQSGGGGSFGSDVQITGNLNVSGTLSKGGGSFKIDDPLDPENKTLSHSFVESPDMMNVYNQLAAVERLCETEAVQKETN